MFLSQGPNNWKNSHANMLLSLLTMSELQDHGLGGNRGSIGRGKGGEGIMRIIHTVLG